MKNRKRWAVTLRRLANRLDPVPASPLYSQNQSSAGTNWTVVIHQPVDTKRIEQRLSARLMAALR